MHTEQRFIGDILVRRGALSQSVLEELLATASEKGVTLQDVAVATRALDEETMLRALADELGLAFGTKLKTDEIPAELIDAVPINFARQHKVLPVGYIGDSVQIALANPLDSFALDDLRALLGKPVEGLVVSSEVIEDAINRVYERKDEQSLADAKEGEEVEELQDLIDMTDEAPVIRWVNNLFYNAVRDRASDIHIEPTDRDVVVRYRIDGDLYPVKTAHKGFLNNIASRVKIEAGLNIAEKRLPQDGRITKKIAGKFIDVRVSTIPTAKGERIVMRLLDKEQVLLNLVDLGFAEDHLQKMEHYIERPNGIILVTGPTGSGKTTTLYACLNKINRPDLNILTVEDPVEYELRGVGQMQVQPKIGLTFASGLRAFLRQDPDVIMIGEIRDHETAEIAVHASLTGHLVISTLHTNDAPGAISRLTEMGVQPFLISSSLLAVLAQRLVRKICQQCREPYNPSDEDLRSIGMTRATLADRIRELKIDPSELTNLAAEATQPRKSISSVTKAPIAPLNTREGVFFRSSGMTSPNTPCEACAGTGYRGRLGIHEMLVIDEHIRREILNQSDAKTIQRIAIQRGMRTLRDDGARLVLLGLTSLEEVLAATQEGSGELE